MVTGQATAALVRATKNGPFPFLRGASVKNPWSQLPANAPRVLPEDCSIIEAFNARYADDPDFAIQPRLPSSRMFSLSATTATPALPKP